MEWQREGEGERYEETPRKKLERQEEKAPLRNQISTTDCVITGKGECNDNHSPLALTAVYIA